MAGGASPKHDRSDADYYPTPVDCTIALLNRCPQFATGVVWEPACGDGAISKVIAQRGACVLSTDLYARGYGVSGLNFLTFPTFPAVTSIVTNPPFNLASEFIARSRRADLPFAMLLKATYWHAASRLSLFRDTGPSMVLPMLWRPAFAPERGKSPTMEFCWTVWDATSSPTCVYEPLPRPEMTNGF
jgi:hypothetical protein